MERASAELINRFLDNDQQSVGISMNLQHSAATPLGISVRVRTELIERDGKKLTFKAEAWDLVEKIGEAIHERFIINAETSQETQFLQNSGRTVKCSYSVQCLAHTYM